MLYEPTQNLPADDDLSYRRPRQSNAASRGDAVIWRGLKCATVLAGVSFPLIALATPGTAWSVRLWLAVGGSLAVAMLLMLLGALCTAAYDGWRTMVITLRWAMRRQPRVFPSSTPIVPDGR